MANPLRAFFAHDHARLIALLDESRRDPACLDHRTYQAFRAGLLHHMALEEHILLPALERIAGGHLEDRLRPTRLEHSALASLLALTPDSELADEVACLLNAHERAEEAPDGIQELVDALALPIAESLLAEIRVTVPPHDTAYADRPGAPRTAQAALAAALQRFETGT